MEIKSNQRKGTKRIFSMAGASVAIGVLLSAVAVAPAHASIHELGYKSCSPSTVVSRTTSTINAYHINKQGTTYRYTDFQGLLIIPETRRAYPNWTYVSFTSLQTEGTMSSFGRECG